MVGGSTRVEVGFGGGWVRDGLWMWERLVVEESTRDIEGWSEDVLVPAANVGGVEKV